MRIGWEAVVAAGWGPLMGLDVALKATGLLVVAWAVHLALGRQRPLVRSSLWNACLVGLILVPAASWLVPRLSLPVLAERPTTVPVGMTPRGPVAALGEDRVNPAFPIGSPPVPPPLDEPIGPRAAPARFAAEPAPPARPSWRWDLPRLTLGVYLAGVLGLVARLLAALVAVGRLRRGAEPVIDPAWREAVARWRDRLGIARRVEVVHSARVAIPVVGWLRPTILLPSPLAGSASPDLIAAILVHELGHVRRGDYGWNLVRKFVGAAYWPHPLTWPLARTIGAVREQACDDLCVHTLGGAPGYRAALLTVAATLVRRPATSLGLAMARTPHLARRLAWIDQTPGSASCLLRWPARTAVLAAVVALSGVIGSIELAPAQAPEPPQQPRAIPKDELKPAEPAPVKLATTPPDAIEVEVLAGDTGKPLVGASVQFLVDHQFVVRMTDRSGTVRFDLSRRVWPDSLGLEVWADGYIQQRFAFSEVEPSPPYERTPARITVKLWPGEETLGGKVVDEVGRPIEGVQVKVWGHLGSRKDEHELAYMVLATTDVAGQWRSRSFRKMKFAHLYLAHPGYVSDTEGTARVHGSSDAEHRPQQLRELGRLGQECVHGSSDAEHRPQPGEPRLASLYDFSDTQIMKRGIEVSGKVSDRDGKPVLGAEVGYLDTAEQFAFHFTMPTVTTDAAGAFRFVVAESKPLAVQVMARGHAPELEVITPRRGNEPLTIMLPRPQVISGRVVDSAGKPIPKVEVLVQSWRGRQTLGVFLKTDTDGLFRWDEAPVDPVLLNVGRAGYIPRSWLNFAPEDGQVRLILIRSLVIAGQIRDSITNQPVDQLKVEVGTVDPKTGEVSRYREEPKMVYANGGEVQAVLDAEASSAYRLRIGAAGYQTFESRVFRSDEVKVANYDVKLVRTDKAQIEIQGVIRRPDGQPLAGAEVVLTYPSGGKSRLPSISLQGGKLQPGRDLTIVKTDAEGRFALGREPDPYGQYYAVLVVHPNCYAEVARAAFEANSTIMAQPWGRIEGVIRTGGRPASGATVRTFSDRLGNPDVPHLFDSGETKADPEGHFVFGRVVPGDVRVYGATGEGMTARSWDNGTLVEVQAGATTRAEVGRRGRPVIARVATPEGFDPTNDYTVYSKVEIMSDRPRMPYPREILAKRDGSLSTWGKQWWASAAAHEYRRNWFESGELKLQPDGTIRADDIPPGEYRLNLVLTADPQPGRSRTRVAVAYRQFTIPPIPGGRSDEPFDLGTLHPKPRATLKVGQAAPGFDVAGLGGGRIRLEDFRGKVVLLDFWATWCGPCVAELPQLQAIQDRFGKDERFALLSLSLDAAQEAPRKFVAERGIGWAQGFLGEGTEGGVPAAYHVEAIPAYFLIGPDGAVRGVNLRGNAIEAAVEQALKGP